MDSQKAPIEVYGDYLEYRTKANQVVTKGRAYIKYRDMHIAADNIQSNTKNEDIFAQGNVNFWKGYDQTTGDLMVYNMKNGKGWVRNATIKRNRNYFAARDVYLSPKYSLARDIMQTTCENASSPHYRIMAREVEIYPGHRMTMKDLRLKWKSATLYRKVADESNLEEKEKFFHTRQGVSQIDGFYFKFNTNLDLGPRVTGIFNYDYFERRGYGFGFSGSYKYSDRSNGSVSIYRLDETVRQHSNTQINLTNNYQMSNGDNVSTSFNYTGDKVAGYAEAQALNTLLNYATRIKFMNVSLNASKFFDLDGEKNTLSDGYQILNRVPEVNLTFPAVTMPLLPITMNVSGMLARYEEGTLKELKKTSKNDMRSSFSAPTVRWGRRFELTPSYNYERSSYSEGTSRETGATAVRASHIFSKTMRAEFNYNISTQKGKSPFQFDYQNTTDIFGTRLAIAENTWSLNPINFSYNRVSQQLEQIYWDYSLRSEQDAYRNWEFFLRRDYIPDAVPFGKMSMTKIKPSNMNVRYRLASALWSFDTNITYPHQYRRITNTSMNYQITIRPEWQINFNSSYNHLDRRFSPLNLSFVKDLHCWEARAEWNQERKEFWLELYLKAYPEDPGRFKYGADTHKLEAKFAAFDQITQRQ